MLSPNDRLCWNKSSDPAGGIQVEDASDEARWIQ